MLALLRTLAFLVYLAFGFVLLRRLRMPTKVYVLSVNVGGQALVETQYNPYTGWTNQSSQVNPGVLVPMTGGFEDIGEVQTLIQNLEPELGAPVNAAGFYLCREDLNFLDIPILPPDGFSDVDSPITQVVLDALLNFVEIKADATKAAQVSGALSADMTRAQVRDYFIGEGSALRVA